MLIFRSLRSFQKPAVFKQEFNKEADVKEVGGVELVLDRGSLIFESSLNTFYISMLPPS